MSSIEWIIHAENLRGAVRADHLYGWSKLWMSAAVQDDLLSVSPLEGVRRVYGPDASKKVCLMR